MTARSAAQERPPPLPPPRAYTVAGGVKLGYPQTRGVLADWADDAAALRLRAGDTVLAVGAARRGHVAVQVTSARDPAGSPLPAPRSPVSSERETAVGRRRNGDPTVEIPRNAPKTNSPRHDLIYFVLCGYFPN